MVLKDTTLCEHSSFHGGDERQFHRGANGYSRFVTCKEDSCDKTVIKAKRKTPHELWSYLVQIALCTKWGQAARSRALFNNVCKVRGEADEERRGLRLPLSDDGRSASLPGMPRSSAPTTSRKTPSEAQVPGWDVVSEAPSSASGYGAPRVAKIVREQEPVCWIYGIRLSMNQDLPAFPTLDDSDLDVLQPLPSDASLLGSGTPYEGLQYDQVASSAESAWYCAQVLDYVLDGRNALHPEIYRFAFYLFGRVKLVHSAGMRCIKSGAARPDKRPANPDDMVANRHSEFHFSMIPITLRSCNSMTVK